MVQGSYPRYVDEEKERLLTKEDEENQLVEVEITEVSSQDEDGNEPEEPPPRCRWSRWKKCCRKKNKDRKKRPMWRRAIRVFFTIGLMYFLFTSFIPFFARMFSCSHGGMRPHHGPHHHGPHHGPPMMGEIHSFERPKKRYEFDSNLDSFFVKQETDHRVPTRSNIIGSVRYVQAEGDRTTLDWHVKVSDDSLWDSFKVSPKKDGMVFSADAFSIVEQYINVTAVVGIPNKIKKLYTSTRELDVSIHKDIVNEFEVTRISTISGDVRVGGIHSSKCMKIRTVSGDVKGSFDLIKGVAVKTVSGDVQIDVKATDSDDDKKAYLGTDTISGDVKVHVIHPLQSRPLDSWHRSTSGDITVRYPEEWEGKMKLSTTSGDFHLKGKHLDIKKKKKGLAGKFWKAIKGNKGKSFAKLQTVSGDCNVSVGDE